MGCCPVLTQADACIRPGFFGAQSRGEIPQTARFFLCSSPRRNDDGLGPKEYFGVARLGHLGVRADLKESPAEESVAALQEAFEAAKEQGEIPQDAEFQVITSTSGGVTQRWAGALVRSWGSYVGTPTIND